MSKPPTIVPAPKHALRDPVTPATAVSDRTPNTTAASAADFFEPAENTTAYLKAGILGFQGAGKTKTSVKLIIGLIRHMRKLKLPDAEKPVYCLDTEPGLDWVLPDFEAAGIAVRVKKTRSYADLVAAVPIAERNASVLFIDSATHFWRELCESYCRRRAEQFRKPAYRLQLNDWDYLKGSDHGWGKFANQFVNSNVHIVLCGRAGYEFNMDEDDDGNKQLEKTGVKMKTENEFGYEPSLLIYMDMHQELKGRSVVRQWREATILKDRSGTIDGQVFEDPDFENFLPHVQRIKFGGRQLGFDASRVTRDIVLPDSRNNVALQRNIVLEEIEALMVVHGGGQSAEAKKRKIELYQKHFGTTSWSAMQAMSVPALRASYDSLHIELAGEPSPYHQKPVSLEMNDSLPGDLAPPALVSHDTMMAQVMEPPAEARPGPDHTERPNGLPAFLDRTAAAPKPANGELALNDERTPPASDNPVDPYDWLAEITADLNRATHFSELEVVQTVKMKPVRKHIPDEVWKLAERMIANRAAKIGESLMAAE